MADERDQRVSQRYRELGAEEPPRALDDAILAAGRRSVRKRNWYGPVALAATLVLVVAVTIQVERQKPDDAYVAAQAPAPEQKKEEQSMREEAAPRRAPEPKPARQQPAAEAGSRGFTPDPAPAASAPAAPPPAPAAPQSADALRDQLAKRSEAPADSARERAPMQQRNDVAETRRMEAQTQAQGGTVYTPAPRPAPASPQAKIAPQATVAAVVAPTPERWLADIIELRRLGRHEDADRSLEQFRKAFPDYKLSEEMRAKVERK